MSRPRILHPILFAAFPVVLLLAHNTNETLVEDALPALGVVLAAALLLWGVLTLAMRSAARAGVVVSATFTLTFSYGHILRVMLDHGVPVGRLLLPGFGLLLVAITWAAARARGDLPRLTSTLNVVSGVLVALSLINIARYETTMRLPRPALVADDSTATAHAAENPPAAHLPDIYYLILDRYGSTSTLREVYDYDNSDFLDALRRRGFYVATRSRANYVNTAESLASSLNMEYLDFVAANGGERSDDETVVYHLIEDNKVARFLKGKGYKFVYVDSGLGATMYSRFADRNISYSALPLFEFSNVLYKTSALFPILSSGLGDDRLEKYHRLRYSFQELAELPNDKQPTFVFADLLIPHPPPVIDRQGKFLPRSEENRRSREENYRESVIVANQLIEDLIDKIIARSDVPPIILLQSDEGPYPLRARRDFDWRQASDDEVRQKFGILNAYYLPGDARSQLYPSITPVNSFRLILDQYFNAGLGLLPDKVYTFVNAKYPFKFIDMTEKAEAR
jgi:hypothetical protein